jgi:tetratricopeptide (TPR) repeat protein
MFGLVIISLVLLFGLRQDEWLTSLRVNRALVRFNQYPVWLAIGNDHVLESVSFVLSYIDNDINDISLARARGLLLFVWGQEEEAIKVWEMSGLLSAEVTAVQGRYAQSVNQPEVALAWYERTVELDPTLASAWHALGELYQQQGESAAAKIAYERAFSLGDASSVDVLARLWREEGNHATAIDIWQSALDTFSEDPDRLLWWQGLSNSLRATAEWEAGIIAVERALQEFPEDARLYVEKGATIYGLSADVTAAIDAINTAITLDDTVTGAYSTAAGIMAAAKQYEEAYDWYTKAISRDPQMPSWQVARGHMARAAGDLPLAKEAFLATIGRFPNFPPAYFGIATVYQQLGEGENAAAAMDQALQLTGKTEVQDYLRAGEIYESSGNLDKAIAVYQQILSLDPDNQTAVQALQRLQNR